MTRGRRAATCHSGTVFAHLLPDTIAPVTAVSRDEPLVRNSYCDGSTRLGSLLPFDLEAAPPGAGLRGLALPGDAVLCMESAWSLHTGRPVTVIAVAAPRTRRPVPGVRTHWMNLGAEDVVVIGGVRCTAFLRTALDLARLADVATAAQALVELRSREQREQFAAALDTHAGWPGIARARALSEMVW